MFTMTAVDRPAWVHNLRWNGDHVLLLDQRLLPHTVQYRAVYTPEDMRDAIVTMQVRGAPAIGMAAAFGLVLAARQCGDDRTHLKTALAHYGNVLREARPTAVNLMGAVDRMVRVAHHAWRDEAWTCAAICQCLLDEVLRMQHEDATTNRTIGEHALSLLRADDGILTHCNAGSLATSSYGTATAPFYVAQEQGFPLRIFATETRPVLQGSRLTVFELIRAGMDVTLITDSMAGMVMAQKKIQAVIVGTDRVAANGDVANKIGTYALAVLAKAHDIPFYVACPTTSIDLHTKTGQDIPIEQRPREEVTHIHGVQVAPSDVCVYNPAFDITPHAFVDALITEHGILTPPYAPKLRALWPLHDV